MTTTAQVRLAIQRQPPGNVSPAAAAGTILFIALCVIIIKSIFLVHFSRIV